MRIDARERLLALLDEGSSQELSADLEPKDILKFKDLKNIKIVLLLHKKKPVKKMH